MSLDIIRAKYVIFDAYLNYMKFANSLIIFMRMIVLSIDIQTIIPSSWLYWTITISLPWLSHSWSLSISFAFLHFLAISAFDVVKGGENCALNMPYALICIIRENYALVKGEKKGRSLTLQWGRKGRKLTIEFYCFWHVLVTNYFEMHIMCCHHQKGGECWVRCVHVRLMLSEHCSWCIYIFYCVLMIATYTFYISNMFWTNPYLSHVKSIFRKVRLQNCRSTAPVCRSTTVIKLEISRSVSQTGRPLGGYRSTDG